MKTIISRNRSLARGSDFQRVVVYRAGSADESVLPFISRLPVAPKLNVHIISGSKRQNGTNLAVNVVPLRQDRGNLLDGVDSQIAQDLLAKCGPGNVPELLIRYSTRIAASLVVMPAAPSNGFTGWWSTSLAERVSRYIPVLAIPAGVPLGPLDTQRRLRWLVPLDGSAAAEAVLEPLRSIASWLPSDITLLQPLQFASLWRSRVAKSRVAQQIGPSIADSWDYLSQIASIYNFASPTRACCTTDSDSVCSIGRLANGPGIDAVALGFSNRGRFTRLVAAELSELLHAKVRKPVLMFRRAARYP
jgi:nucleotide-binding universal stress UspA family protein